MMHKQQEIIDQRKEIITLFKEDLIRRLNLPYQPEDLHEDISLLGAGLGLDSLDALEIVLSIENTFGIKVPEESPEILRSINTIVDFIIEKKCK